MKGRYNKECNRTACNNQEAVFYNHSTRLYYCKSCAILINEQNRTDAQRLFGHDLCTPCTPLQLDILEILNADYDNSHTITILKGASLGPTIPAQDLCWECTGGGIMIGNYPCKVCRGTGFIRKENPGIRKVKNEFFPKKL
jgi:hypothetical protein